MSGCRNITVDLSSYPSLPPSLPTYASFFPPPPQKKGQAQSQTEEQICGCWLRIGGLEGGREGGREGGMVW